MVPFSRSKRKFRVGRLASLVPLCLFVLAAPTQLSFAQLGNDPQQLQKSGIVRIDRWTDHVRRTGEAKTVLSELAAAQAELKASYDLFLQRQDFAGATNPRSISPIGPIARTIRPKLWRALHFQNCRSERLTQLKNTFVKRCGWERIAATRISSLRHSMLLAKLRSSAATWPPPVKTWIVLWP
jgi:hypothetical protein